MDKPGTGSSVTNRHKWLFLSFTLPARPSRARVHAWRQLKKLGAVSYQSAWVLPYSRDKASELEKLLGDIESHKGSGVIVEGRVLRPVDEEGIRQALLAASNEEYGELIEKCDDFLKELEMEKARRNFIFAEVEENEEDLEKLRKWLRKVEKRASLESPLRKAALSKMKLCEKAMNEFAQIVFAHTQGKQG
ncbi:MAG: Chromate resistance protein ChrB [Thermodesulfobacteriota bacterium]